MTSERMTTSSTYNYGSAASITVTLAGFNQLASYGAEALLYDLAALGTSVAQAAGHPEITLGDMADAIAHHSGMMHQLSEERQAQVRRLILEQDTRAEELRTALQAADEVRHDVHTDINEFLSTHPHAAQYVQAFLDDLQVKLRGPED
jgi:hypothetical protein